MRARVVGMTVLLAVTVTASVGAIGWAMRADPVHAFIRTAVNEFRRCRTLADVRALPHDGKSQLVIWEFQDGSWIASRNHPSDHHVQDWDATIILDSQGKLYHTEEHFCAGFVKLKTDTPPIPSLQAFHRAFRLEAIE